MDSLTCSVLPQFIAWLFLSCDSSHGGVSEPAHKLRLTGRWLRHALCTSRSDSFMAYVITDACVKDFVCVTECATSAIAPLPADPAAGTVSQVFINPDECIDCGNCATLCEN